MFSQDNLDSLRLTIERECLRGDVDQKEQWRSCLQSMPIIKAVGAIDRLEFRHPKNCRYHITVEISRQPTTTKRPHIISVDFIAWEPLYDQRVQCIFDYCIEGGGLIYLRPIQASLTLLDTNLIALLEYLKRPHN